MNKINLNNLINILDNQTVIEISDLETEEIYFCDYVAFYQNTLFKRDLGDALKVVFVNNLDKNITKIVVK